MNRALSWTSIGFMATVVSGVFLPKKPLPPLVEEKTVVEEPVSPLEQKVQQLNAEFGYELVPEDLVALTRLAYFEDKFDRKLDGDEEQRKGFAAVIEVVRNRYLFDLCSPDAPVRHPVCDQGGKPGLFSDGDELADVMFYYVKQKKKRVYHFTPVGEYRDYFTASSLGRRELNDRANSLDAHQLALAYEAVVGVLDGSFPPLTGGALYYKNSDLTRAKWHGKEAFSFVDHDCGSITKRPEEYTDVQKKLDNPDGTILCRVDRWFVHDYTKTMGGHDFYKVVEDASRREENVWFNGCRFQDGKISRARRDSRYCKALKKDPR